LDVYEAVTSRRAVGGFTDRPVPGEVLQRVLSAAAWAPSGSNLQPWHAYVVTGGPLADLKKRASERRGMQPSPRRVAPEGRFHELGRFRRARGPVLLHRPRPGPAPMVWRRHVPTDRHAAARAEGLHSCTQMAWATYHKTVAEMLSPPDELILFCGMSIGSEDVTVHYPRTGRAPLDETVTFVEG